MDSTQVHSIFDFYYRWILVVCVLFFSYSMLFSSVWDLLWVQFNFHNVTYIVHYSKRIYVSMFFIFWFRNLIFFLRYQLQVQVIGRGPFGLFYHGEACRICSNRGGLALANARVTARDWDSGGCGVVTCTRGNWRIILPLFQINCPNFVYIHMHLNVFYCVDTYKSRRFN
jgi:hypothetical protein